MRNNPFTGKIVKTNLKSPCDSIPAECVSNGKLDVDCLCKIWCSLGCGGAACNCFEVPKK